MITQARAKDGRLLAACVSYRPSFDSLQFYSDPSDILQTAQMVLPEGHVVPAHSHNPVKRETVGTAEVFLVMYGSVRLDLPEWEGRGWLLETGDVVIIYPGTVHGLKAIEQSRLFEVKNGPYIGKEADKTLFKEERHAPQEANSVSAQGGPDPVPGAGAGALLQE